jgi:hypothetical protein
MSDIFDISNMLNMLNMLNMSNYLQNIKHPPKPPSLFYENILPKFIPIFCEIIAMFASTA